MNTFIFYKGYRPSRYVNPGIQVNNVDSFNGCNAGFKCRSNCSNRDPSRYNCGFVDTCAESGVVDAVLVSDGCDHDDACKVANGQTWSFEKAKVNPLEHPNYRREFSPIKSEDLFPKDTEGFLAKKSTSTVKDGKMKPSKNISEHISIPLIEALGTVVNYAGTDGKISNRVIYNRYGTKLSKYIRIIMGQP